MNAERLLEHYERIADAPEAIGRLRRFVLDLAVLGKIDALASNDRTEVTILECLEPLGDGRLVHQGWSPQCESGPSTKVEEWGALKTTAIQDGAFAPEHNKRLPVSLTPKPMLEVRDGDILLTCAGPRARCGVVTLVRSVRPKLFISGKMYRFRANGARVDPEYLELYLRSPSTQSAIDRMKTGSSESGLNLTQDRFAKLPVHFGTLSAQRAVVARVSDLMALCDQLEVAREAREVARDRLAAASLARLNTPDPDTFADDARFALDALPALTTRPDQIKQLRQTILNLAVRGGLSVESEWACSPRTLGDLATLQNGYAFKSEWFAKSGTRLVRNANVGHGVLDWGDEVRLPDAMVAEYERFGLHAGDVVLSLDRPFIVSGTKVARISPADTPALLLQRVGRFVLSSELSSDFLFLWINSPHFTDQIDPGRSNGVPHISSKQVEAAGIFVPPLAEQHRIVAKVDDLMALCDQLEASLDAAAATRRRLLDTLLAEALAPAGVRELEQA